MIGMTVKYRTSTKEGCVTFHRVCKGTVDAVSVMADGLAIARVCDRWVPVDELVAV